MNHIRIPPKMTILPTLLLASLVVAPALAQTSVPAAAPQTGAGVPDAQPAQPVAQPAQPVAQPAQPVAQPAQPAQPVAPVYYVQPGTQGYYVQPSAPVAMYYVPVAVPPETAPEPSTGLGMLITGSILSGIGVASLGASVTVCEDDSDPAACRGATVLLSLATLGPGIPLFIVGMMRRSRHKTWEATNRRSAETLPQLHLGAARSPLGLTLESRF
jgi:hypothetical protein